MPSPVPPRYASPREAKSAITRGETRWPWRVWALQKALDSEPQVNMADFGGIDGVFGAGTEKAVRLFQAHNEIDPVGFAGPRTQLTLLAHAEQDVHVTLPALPAHVLTGFTVFEGGAVLADTNWWTPPGDPDGVDCGPPQLRCLGPPFNVAHLQRAFDARAAFLYAGSKLLQRKAEYRQRCADAGRPITHSEGLRLAVLAHNAPFLSEQLVRNGRLRTPDARPTSGVWAIKPDGQGWYSHGEWAVEYPRRILTYTLS